MKKKSIIPIFFSTDDGYAPCLAVALNSLTDHLSPHVFAEIHILTSGLCSDNISKIKSFESDNISISIDNISEQIINIADSLHVRDYYSAATYYRFFIPSMFPQYDKCLYLDCDIVINRNINELYRIGLGNNLLAAAPDDVIRKFDVFGRYVESVLNVPRENYFNAGILVMNLSEMRKFSILERFEELLSKRKFRVAQDQDYLNCLCFGRVEYLDILWNKTPFCDEIPEHDSKIIHFKLGNKPWKYDNIPFAELFQHYAEGSHFMDALTEMKNNYTADMKLRDILQFEELMRLAESEITDVAPDMSYGIIRTDLAKGVI